MIRNLLFIALGIFAVSCIKDEPVVSSAGDVNISGPRIFILNEGNFGTGNSSLSLYDEKTGDVVEDIYRHVNSENLGDVLQSMTLADRKYYLVINHSGKIVVCDKQLKKVAQITGLPSPRYFLAIDRHKAYVTDYSANKIHIVNLAYNTVGGSIPCAGWTEHLVLAGDQVIVTNVKSEFLYFIDPKSDKLVDSLKVGLNASGLVVDDHNLVWVLTSGDQSKSIDATLTRIDPGARKILHQRSIGPGPASALCTNGKRDELYFVSTHIYKVSINTITGMGDQLIAGDQKMIYGFGVHPDSGKLFVSDAVDFSQRSIIYEYDANGQEIRSFKAGIISNGFYFE